jgi:hypothetical protein
MGISVSDADARLPKHILWITMQRIRDHLIVVLNGEEPVGSCTIGRPVMTLHGTEIARELLGVLKRVLRKHTELALLADRNDLVAQEPRRTKMVKIVAVKGAMQPKNGSSHLGHYSTKNVQLALVRQVVGSQLSGWPPADFDRQYLAMPGTS